MIELHAGHMLGLGLLLAFGWLISLILCLIVQKAWKWVDDDTTPIKALYAFTPVLWLMRCERTGTGFSYRKKDGGGSPALDPEFGGAALFFGALFFLPMAIFIGIKFYAVTLAIILVILLAHLARFAKRLRKAFDKHVKDPDAHK